MPASADGAQAAARAAAPPGKKAPLPPLPQLYLNGKLIGSLEELRALDDQGRLGPLLEAHKRDLTSARPALVHATASQGGADLACDACGGRRFVVCAECNGSRKGRKVFDSYLKCSHCNENGLQPCRACGTGSCKS